jgi:transcriptional regulator with XRE-family HTH domain
MLRSFTQKKVHSYTLGEQLKNIRSTGRITLSEVSRETKIPVKYLEMIEEGKYENLPPDVYVKGFLKGYAEFLGADPKKMINLYQRERDIKSNLSGDDKKIAPVKIFAPARFVITPRIVVASAVALVVFGGFFYIYRQIGRFAAVPRLVVAGPSDGENVEGNSIEITGFTDKDAKLTINEQPIIVNDRGEFKENVLLQKGINAIKISSTNRFEKSASETFNIKSNYQTPELANIESEGKVSGEEDARKRGVSVIVRAESVPTWLSVEADGNLIYSGTMLPGAIQNFDGEKEVRVTSGKANQTFVRVNGKDEKKLADDPGIVRDVLFTPNN